MSQPVYKSFPDATFGHGTGTDWVSRFPLPQVQDLWSRKAAQLDEVRGIAVVETEGKGRNHPNYLFYAATRGIRHQPSDPARNMT